MEKDWYQIEYEEKEYLHNKKIVLKKYECVGSEHTHCELCWDRFSNAEKDLHVGYYEADSNSWICESCCKDLKDLFGWQIEFGVS